MKDWLLQRKRIRKCRRTKQQVTEELTKNLNAESIVNVVFQSIKPRNKWAFESFIAEQPGEIQRRPA
jgi:hypothetical protein